MLRGEETSLLKYAKLVEDLKSISAYGLVSTRFITVVDHEAQPK